MKEKELEKADERRQWGREISETDGEKWSGDRVE